MKSKKALKFFAKKTNLSNICFSYLTVDDFFKMININTVLNTYFKAIMSDMISFCKILSKKFNITLTTDEKTMIQYLKNIQEEIETYLIKLGPHTKEVTQFLTKICHFEILLKLSSNNLSVLLPFQKSHSVYKEFQTNNALFKCLKKKGVWLVCNEACSIDDSMFVINKIITAKPRELKISNIDLSVYYCLPSFLPNSLRVLALENVFINRLQGIGNLKNLMKVKINSLISPIKNMKGFISSLDEIENLKILILQNCQLGESNMIELFGAIKEGKMDKLEELDLSCNLYDENERALPVIGDALMKRKNLIKSIVLNEICAEPEEMYAIPFIMGLPKMNVNSLVFLCNKLNKKITAKIDVMNVKVGPDMIIYSA